MHELTRDTWTALWLERLGQDLRFGARTLRRTPGFAVVAVLCLTLGIGANAAVLSWMEGILLRPYPGVAEQDRVVAVAGTATGTGGFDSMSWPDFMDLSRGTTSFSSFIASKITGATLTGSDRPDRLVGLLVSANYFDALGVRPVRGRGFLSGEDVGDARIRYGHRLSRVARSLSFRPGHRRQDDRPQRRAAYDSGVAPEEFLGTFVGYTMQFWLPASQQPSSTRPATSSTTPREVDRGLRTTQAGRYARAGANRDQRRGEATRDRQSQRRSGRGVTLLSLWNAPFDGAKELLPMLRVALIVAIFVLVIACANVANLRSSDRSRGDTK